MSTSPAATPVTRPALLTVAMAGLDDDHDTSLVTGWESPLEKTAVAVNWAVAPTVGAAPETVTAETVREFPFGAVGDEFAAVGELAPQPNSDSHTAVNKETVTAA